MENEYKIKINEKKANLNIDKMSLKNKPSLVDLLKKDEIIKNRNINAQIVEIPNTTKFKKHKFEIFSNFANYEKENFLNTENCSEDKLELDSNVKNFRFNQISESLSLDNKIFNNDIKGSFSNINSNTQNNNNGNKYKRLKNNQIMEPKIQVTENQIHDIPCNSINSKKLDLNNKTLLDKIVHYPIMNNVCASCCLIQNPIKDENYRSKDNKSLTSSNEIEILMKLENFVKSNKFICPNEEFTESLIQESKITNYEIKKNFHYLTKRNDIIILLENLTRKNNLSFSTLNLSIFILDYVFNVLKTNTSNLDMNLIGIASFLISAKYNENDPYIQSLASLKRVYDYNINEIKKYEVLLLKLLNYKINFITPCNLIEILLCKGVITNIELARIFTDDLNEKKLNLIYEIPNIKNQLYAFLEKFESTVMLILMKIIKLDISIEINSFIIALCCITITKKLFNLGYENIQQNYENKVLSVHWNILLCNQYKVKYYYFNQYEKLIAEHLGINMNSSNEITASIYKINWDLNTVKLFNERLINHLFLDKRNKSNSNSKDNKKVFKRNVNEIIKNDDDFASRNLELNNNYRMKIKTNESKERSLKKEYPQNNIKAKTTFKNNQTIYHKPKISKKTIVVETLHEEKQVKSKYLFTEELIREHNKTLKEVNELKEFKNFLGKELSRNSRINTLNTVGNIDRSYKSKSKSNDKLYKTKVTQISNDKNNKISNDKLISKQLPNLNKLKKFQTFDFQTDKCSEKKKITVNNSKTKSKEKLLEKNLLKDVTPNDIYNKYRTNQSKPIDILNNIGFNKNNDNKYNKIKVMKRKQISLIGVQNNIVKNDALKNKVISIINKTNSKSESISLEKINKNARTSDNSVTITQRKSLNYLRTQTQESLNNKTSEKKSLSKDDFENKFTIFSNRSKDLYYNNSLLHSKEKNNKSSNNGNYINKFD